MSSNWFSTDGFMPHGHCYLWRTDLIALHAGSDLTIGAAYFLISLILYFFLRKNRIPFSGLFGCFGVFIAACGMTHFFEAWTLWHPDYWLSGFMKTITALASILTAALLFASRTKISKFIEASTQSQSRAMELARQANELKTTNEALLKSEERYRKLVDGVQDYAIFALDVHGNVAGWNYGARKIKQYEAAEIIGQHFSRFYPIEDKEAGKPEHELKQAASTGRYEDEGFRIRKDGTRFFANVIITPIHDAQGALQGFSKITRDITERKQMEQDLRRAHERLSKGIETAVEASQMKSDFLAKMSHEIRTPLNCILGMSDVLSDTPLDPEQKKIVVMSKRASVTLLHLVNDVLDLAKVEAGKLVLNVMPFDLRETVDHCIGMLSFRASKKGIALTKTIDPALPACFLGDSPRIQQILLNLISNAIKFTSKGSVDIRVGFSVSDPGSSYIVSLSVADSGIGIPAALQEQLFEKFNQLDPGVANTYGGTGLGLSISRHLAELMRGSIVFQSQQGIGSVFRLTIPLEIGEPPHEALSERQLNQGAPLSILVVDDIDDNRMLIELYLKDCGHKLIFAESGQQAIDLIKTHPVQLILMDINMPGIDGFEAVRRIRKWEHENLVPRTKIVALTAYALDKDAQQAKDAGCDAHLPKPISKDTLLKLVLRTSSELSNTDPDSR